MNKEAKIRFLKKALVVKTAAWCALFLLTAGFVLFAGNSFAAEEAGAAKKEISTGLGLLAIGAGLAIGGAALGTGLAQAKIGAAGIGAMAEKPELKGLAILMVAIPETMVIFGFVIAVLIMTMLVK